MAKKQYFIYLFFLCIYSLSTFANTTHIETDYAVFISTNKSDMEKALLDITVNQENKIKHIVLIGNKDKLNADTVYKITKELNKKRKTLTRFIERTGKQNATQLNQSDLWKYIWDMKVPRKIKKKYISGKNLYLIQHVKKNIAKGLIENYIETFIKKVKPQGKCHFFIPSAIVQDGKVLKQLQKQYAAINIQFVTINNKIIPKNG